MKCCTQCGETKPPSEFYRRKSECKACSIARTRRWQAENPDRLKAYQAQRTHDPEKAREKYARRKDDPNYRANARERARKWRAANRERHRAYAAAWSAEHPDKFREIQRNAQRRYRQEKRVGRLPESVIYADILRGDPCGYCGSASEAIDHIAPVSRGGGNEWANLTAACHSCNSRKHNATLLEFLWRNR